MTVDRRAQAVQLRLAGLSRSQIAEALGLGSGGEPLSTWLQGVPAPAWTHRPRAKDDLRETAVAMRMEGRSYREIQTVVGVAKSTLSLWLRDVPLTEDQQQASRREGLLRPRLAPLKIEPSAQDGGRFSRLRRRRRSPG